MMLVTEHYNAEFNAQLDVLLDEQLQEILANVNGPRVLTPSEQDVVDKYNAAAERALYNTLGYGWIWTEFRGYGIAGCSVLSYDTPYRIDFNVGYDGRKHFQLFCYVNNDGSGGSLLAEGETLDEMFATDRDI